MKHELTNITYEGYRTAKAQLHIERVLLSANGRAETYHSVSAYITDSEGVERLGQAQHFHFDFNYEGGDIRIEALQKLGEFFNA